MISPSPSSTRSRAGRSTFATMWHPECPIEQFARTADPERREALLREAWRREHRGGGARLIAHADGLRILAESEGALNSVVAKLRAAHGDSLVLEPPAIRYVHGAHILEPWMEVLVNVPERYGLLLKHDFGRRRGSIRRLAQQGAAFVLEGEAPLATLLGYGDWVGELTGTAPSVMTRLSRYVPIDHEAESHVRAR